MFSTNCTENVADNTEKLIDTLNFFCVNYTQALGSVIRLKNDKSITLNVYL